MDKFLKIFGIVQTVVKIAQVVIRKLSGGKNGKPQKDPHQEE